MMNAKNAHEERMIAIKNLNTIFQIERDIQDFLGVRPVLEDLHFFQKTIDDLLGVASFLQEETTALTRCENLQDVIAGLYGFEMNVLIQDEINKLVDLFINDLLRCISDLKYKSINKLCELK